MLTKNIVIKDEMLFTIIHFIGAFCGGIGLLGALAAFIERRSHALLKYTFPFLLILTLIPYLVLLIYWFILKFKDQPKEWFDEKQFRDISKAALFTLLLSVPFMGFQYILNYASPLGPIDILWFPIYLFFIMLCFSVSALYFSRLE